MFLGNNFIQSINLSKPKFEVLMMSYPTLDEIIEIRLRLKEATMTHWLHAELFHLNWWINLILTLLPLYIWWKLVDKQRVFKILTFGLMIATVSIILDIAGINLVWWGYPNQLLPIIPPIFPFDVSNIAVLNMMRYQYFSTWKAFIKAKLVLAATYSFIFEPLFVVFGFYELYSWKYWYSFVGYIIISVLMRWIVEKIDLSANGSKHKEDSKRTIL